MPKNKITSSLASEIIAQKIYLIRNKKVMLDFELAELYGVATKRLNEQVKRNIHKFPEEFMFKLSSDEWKTLRSQFATSNIGRGGKRYPPYAFTEHGTLQVANVLNSPKANEVSIFVIKAFLKFREVIYSHLELKKQIEKIESQLANHDEEITAIFKVIKELIQKPQKPKKEIGFHTSFKNK